MAFLHRPELYIGPDPARGESEGLNVDVFDAYDFTSDCLRPGNGFTFSLWRSADRRAQWPVLQRRVRLGAPVSFRMDDALQLNGTIEEFQELSDRNGGTRIVISGRDIGARVLEWDANPIVSFQNLSLFDALTELYSDLGIAVVLGVLAEDARNIQTGALRGTAAVGRRRHRRNASVVNRGHPRVGEKVWAVAEAFCRKAGLFQWVAPIDDLGEMGIVLGRYDYKSPPLWAFTRHVDPINGEVVGNAVSVTHAMQARNIPTEVKVFGHGARGDVLSARNTADLGNHYLTDTQINVGRVHSEFPRQPRYVKSQRSRSIEESRQEADRIIARTMQGFRTYTVTVQGHAQTTPSGARLLYAPNTVATVSDDVLGLNERMWVHRVQMKGRREGGCETTLTLLPLGSVQLTVGVVEST